MRTMLVAVDVVGFIAATDGHTPRQVGRWLLAYYTCVAEAARSHGFRVIKTVGDCVLLRKPIRGRGSPAEVRRLHAAISRSYRIEVLYRACDVAPVRVRLGGYRCDDVFGRDFHLLFQKDAATGEIR